MQIACMDFPGASMRLSRHQDKLLQTPATLETLGSTSAVHGRLQIEGLQE